MTQPPKPNTNLGKFFQTMAGLTEGEIQAMGSEIKWNNYELVGSGNIDRRAATATVTAPIEILLNEAPEKVKEILLPMALQAGSFNLDLRTAGECIYNPSETATAIAAQHLDWKTLKIVMNHALENRDDAKRLKDIMTWNFGQNVNPAREHAEDIQRCLETLSDFDWQLINRLQAQPDAEIYRRTRLLRLKIEILDKCLPKLTVVAGKVTHTNNNAKDWANYWLDNLEQCELNTLRLAIVHRASANLLERIWQRIPVVKQYSQGKITCEAYRHELGNSLYRQQILIKAWERLNELKSKNDKTINIRWDQSGQEKENITPEFTAEAKICTEEFCGLAKWCIQKLTEFNLKDNELLTDSMAQLKVVPEQEIFERQLLELLKTERTLVHSRELATAFTQENDKWLLARANQALQQQMLVTELMKSLAETLKTSNKNRTEQLNRLAQHWKLIHKVAGDGMGSKKFASEAELTARETVDFVLRVEHHQKLAQEPDKVAKALRL